MDFHERMVFLKGGLFGLYALMIKQIG